MRTLPLLAVLFIPIIVAVWQRRIYPWAMLLESIPDLHIREHLEAQLHQELPEFLGFLHPRRYLFRHLERALLPAFEVVEANRSSGRA